jgi:hypothetical protein
MANLKNYRLIDAEFNGEINNDINYLNATGNKNRLIITSAANAALTVATFQLSIWNSSYLQIFNSSINTSTVRANLRNAQTQLKNSMRIIIADIPDSLLTQTDRETLKLYSKPASRIQANVPQSIPFITVTEHKHLKLVIFVGNTEIPNRKAKPAEANGIEIEIAFYDSTAALPTDTPPDKSFNHIISSGKTKIEIPFTSEQIKGTAYIRARYINSRKETGQWSEIISCIVI